MSEGANVGVGEMSPREISRGSVVVGNVGRGDDLILI